MLFNSFAFALFFPIVTALYFFLPYRYRWLLLLIASCGFYMFFEPIYILILLFTIVVDYIAGIYIEKTTAPRKRKTLLLLSLIANIGVLAIFKYFNFINENLTDLVNMAGMGNPVPYLKILLPIGLSFHTFQAMSYTIEVYRGNQIAEKHFGIYALYVMFYPQLVAGPIERPQNVIYQFYEKHSFNYERVVSGLRLMLWGFFKKIVVADRLAVFVSQVFDHSSDYQGIPILIACIFFAFQIYCDFSGYSDIALGAAEVMGYKLMLNFKRPYTAESISEFWSRWHISLSTWFRDYLYIPLGGNRVSVGRRYINLFIVFLVSGIWHGASWNFIIWGAIHGSYTVLGNLKNQLIGRFSYLTDKIPSYVSKPFNIGITFSLVTFAWIFFRAQNLDSATTIIQNLFSFKNSTSEFDFYQFEVLFGFLIIGTFLLLENVFVKDDVRSAFQRSSPAVKWSLYLFISICILNIGNFNENSFIYFQF
jgi:D-alanyl-lipoteichoic acid acyltransferase DltB (MBOAT superfamily)